MGCCGQSNTTPTARPAPSSVSSVRRPCEEGRIQVRYTGPETYLVTPNGNAYGIRRTGDTFCALSQDSTFKDFEVLP